MSGKPKLIITFLLTLGVLQAKEYTVRDGLTAQTYNDILDMPVEQEMRLSYDTEEGTFLWYIEYTMFPVAIKFTDRVRHTLLEHIHKYREWNEKAKEEGVEIKKEIGSLPITTAYFKYGNSWERDSRCIVHIEFLSVDTQVHMLVISLETLESDYNEFITHMPDALFFLYDDVETLESAISDRAIRQYLEEVEKKQSVEEEFK